VLKIKDNSNTQVRDPQIVQHQSTFVISDSVNHLCIHDNSIKCDQVGNEETDLVFFVEDIEQRLLAERNVLQTKLKCQRIFIRLLNQSVTKRVKNLDGTADNLKNFLLWPTTFRYSCPFVFISG
jgi:vancomycin resistance protein YoaR